MIQPIDIFLYIYLLTNERVMNNFEIPEPPRVSVGYCDYTTTHIITNKDMYSLDKINDIILTDKAQKELNP